MARAVLLIGGATWIIAAAVTSFVAGFGTEEFERVIPPLTIDTDALRGAVVAVACGLLAVGLAHVVALIGVRARRRWGSTAAILLAGLLSATFVALSATAAASAVATPSLAPLLAAAGLGAGVAALAYGAAVVVLVGERRAGSAF